MSRPETYVSIDIETDGPAPGLNSLLALGAVAFVRDEVSGEIFEWGDFYVKLEPLPQATPHPETAKWWADQTEALAEVRADQQPAEAAINRFARWVIRLPGKPVAVAWPAAYDFAFVNWYLHRYVGFNPLGFACADIRSYANGIARQAFYYGLQEAEVNSLVGEIDKSGLRAHVAVDDARAQGRLFVALLRRCERKVVDE